MMTVATAKKSFRERQHNVSNLSVKDLIRTRIEELGIDNTTVQKALGYAKPNVIAMLKMGSMRLPDNKAVACAKVLQLDPVFMLSKVMTENNADLWKSIESVMGDRLVSTNEMKLVSMLRENLGGFDIDLANDRDFMQALAPALAKLVNQRTDGVRDKIARLESAAARKPE